MIPSYGVAAPGSARAALSSLKGIPTTGPNVDDILNSDAADISKKLAKTNDKQLKDLTLQLVKKLREEQIDASNDKAILEAQLGETQQRIKDLQSKLEMTTADVQATALETKILSETKENLLSRVSTMQRDAQLIAKNFQNEISQLRSMSTTPTTTSSEQETIARRIAEAREEARIETELAMQAAIAEGEEEANSLQGMRHDLLALKKKNATLLAELEAVRNRVAEAEERIKKVELKMALSKQ